METENNTAVIAEDGRQFRVTPGDIVDVYRKSVEVGTKISFSDVRLVSSANGETLVGTPSVAGAEVKGTVLGHPLDEKKFAYKRKRRKGFRNKKGHRQPLTRVMVDSIETQVNKVAE